MGEEVSAKVDKNGLFAADFGSLNRFATKEDAIEHAQETLSSGKYSTSEMRVYRLVAIVRRQASPIEIEDKEVE